ncbi:MAG: GNAT family N-acetyltransferase [Acidimicrobiales bacterium]
MGARDGMGADAPHSATVAPIAVTAGSADTEPLGDVLQAAFWDDPVFVWMLPDEASRARRAARVFMLLLRAHYMPMRTVWTTPDHAGAALWAPPGHAIIPTAAMIKRSPALVQALGRHTFRVLRGLDHIDRQHPKDPHWYLGVLGTAPPHQGKGVGSALMAPVLERCDDDGIPAYLESSKEANIAFYRRHGFEVTGEIRVPGGPVLWPMWREPRPC